MMWRMILTKKDGGIHLLETSFLRDLCWMYFMNMINECGYKVVSICDI